MPHTSYTATPVSNVDAPFRAWGKGLSDALALVGMVKTADTGQIDWTTVAAATTVSTVAGYEVWRFNDPLQATAPIFFKLEYGTAPTVNSPRITLTVGKGSDGAGNITGILHTAIQAGLITTLNAGAVDASCHVASCLGGSCVIAMLFSETSGSATNTPPGFIIERSRDNLGRATTAGVMVALSRGYRSGQAASSSPNYVAAINYASGSMNTSIPPVVVPYTIAGTVISGASSLASGVIAPVFPWLIFAPGLAPWQPMSCLSYMEGDAIGGVVTNRLLGANHDYRVIPVSSASNGWGVSVNPSGGTTMAGSLRVGLMILWEG